MSFTDFYVTPLTLFPHRANYVSELEGFANFGEWIYRQVGCLGTRKFVNDHALVKNIRRVIKRGDILVLYPEARYANVGTASDLPVSLGKLVKLLNVPVVTVIMHGNYLQSPIWNLKKRRGVPLEASACQLLTAEQIQSLSVDDINAQLKDALSYDEYQWQLDNKLEISQPWRAEGLEHALYQCPVCKAEYRMNSQGSSLYCGSCGEHWEMTSLGQLAGKTFSRIPDWYQWQREQVQTEIDSGRYQIDIPVEIEALPNAKGFISLGAGRLVHRQEGFYLSFENTKLPESIFFSGRSMPSLHTEYDYQGKGPCVVLSTVDNSYFTYPKAVDSNVTKMMFAAEYAHQLAHSE